MWRPFALLFAVMVGFFLSVSMLIPILPLYLQELGASAVHVGWIVGSFSIGVLVVRPVLGRILDTRGRRLVLVLGSVIATLMAPLYIVFTSLFALILVRIVHGIGLSAHTSAATTLVADLAPPERRTEFMGYLSAASIGGMAIAAPLAVELANRYSYQTVFVTATAFAAASVVGAMALREPAHERHEAEPIEYRPAILRRVVVVPSITLFLATFTMGGTLAFLPILLEERRPEDFGWFFVVNAVVALVSRVLAGRIARTSRDRQLIVGGLLIHAAGLAVLPAIHGFGSMVFAAALSALGFAAFWPGLYGLVVNATGDRARGMVLSVFLGAFDLGMAVGGLGSGSIVERIGIPAMLTALALVPVIAVTFFTLSLRGRPKAPAWVSTV